MSVIDKYMPLKITKIPISISKPTYFFPYMILCHISPNFSQQRESWEEKTNDMLVKHLIESSSTVGMYDFSKIDLDELQSFEVS